MEELKCAFPHPCTSKDCFYCKANYDFIVEKPITLKCGHKICTQCDLSMSNKMSYLCALCARNKQKITIEKQDIKNPTLERMFNHILTSFIDKSFVDLKEKMKLMQGEI